MTRIEMFNKLLGLNVKIIYKDIDEKGNYKAIKGKVIEIKNNFIELEQGNKIPFFVNLEFIMAIRMIE